MPNRDQRLVQLMQLLGLVQAQKEHQAQTAFGYAGLDRQNQRDQNQKALGMLQLQQTGQFHQGEMDHQKAMEALGLRQADSADAQNQALIAHQNALLGAQKDSESNRMNMEFMTHLMNNPNVPLEKALPALAALDPRFSKVGQVMHQGAVESAVQAQLPAISGMYGQYNQSHDYGQLQKGLAALQPTMGPEVWGGLPWEQLNNAMSPMAPRTGLSFGFHEQIPQDIPSDLQQGFNLEQGYAQQQQMEAQQKLQQQQELAKRNQALNYLQSQKLNREIPNVWTNIGF